MRYIIPELSAHTILSSEHPIDLSEPTKKWLITERQQEDCAMFYQAMKVLGKRPEGWPCRDLYDVLIYLDFSGIFNRKPAGKVLELQKKAECLFRPEGFSLDFGNGSHRYIAFERSASKSRANHLSFVREDVYAPLRQRMMLGMDIGVCQLSKLYAYNALMYTDGERYEDANLLYPEKIIVIDNPKSMVRDVDVITVEDDGTDNAVRKYRRVEKTADIEVLEFDGEGLISKEMAHRLDPDDLHHSFQIRLPYIKGVVHEVDYKSLFRELGVSEITDIWGKRHRVDDVEMILTKSMFKGFGWMTDCGLTWAEYLHRCREYDHALYVSGKDQTQPEATTELNYQFLTTLSVTEEEFRPKDLPLGWEHSPALDARHWLTKTTETAYYELTCDDEKRREHLLRELNAPASKNNDYRAIYRRQRLALLQKNPRFLDEATFVWELKTYTDSILRQYGTGQLMIAGDNRYLSDDLIRLLYVLSGDERLLAECLTGNEMYAPQPGYAAGEAYTLLRSPHIARNEEALAEPMKNVGPLRKKYLSHLGYVLMVDSRSLIPERLGGADYDGDMIKTIADPLLNECVRRGYANGVPPLLKIPTAQPLMADARDWYARFQTVKSTFSSRVGQISNAALRRGVIAYDENTNDTEKEQCRKDTEVLCILTGLEIDSAKSGVKPDLSEYLEERRGRKSLFLRYKAIVDDKEERKWYEDTELTRKKKFFASVDWDAVSSNLEKLPYYAWMLEQETPKHVPTPASDAELFEFAKDPEWKSQRDPRMMQRMESLIADYDAAQKRLRYRDYGSEDMKRQKDVKRILFSRGQEEQYTVDELYAAFDFVNPRAIRKARRALTEQQWHLTPPEERKTVLYDILPTAGTAYMYTDLFTDFRNSGYRVLGDILCDLDDRHSRNGIENHLIRKDDSKELRALLRPASTGVDQKTAVIRNCHSVMQPPGAKERFDYEEALKCAIALGQRSFVLEVMPGEAAKHAVAQEDKPKRRRLFRR